MWYVYVLKSQKDGFFYIRMSSDPEKRLVQHNKGYTTSTKSRKPFTLIFKEAYNTRIEARIREKWLKSGIGREYIKNNIRGVV